jgi:hypothetical protein
LSQAVSPKPAGADAGMRDRTASGTVDAGAPVTPDAPASDGGCGCRLEAPRGTNGALAAFSALAAVALVASRRRGRR